MAGFRTTGACTSSQKSGPIRDDSTQFVEQEETSSLGSPLIERMPTEWTDEKHSLYLKSMEASFVNQLYNSTDVFGWKSRKVRLSDPHSSRQIHLNTRPSSGQFKVLRGTFWEKINFERTEPQSVDQANSCHDLLENNWIQHFRSSHRQVGTSPTRQSNVEPKRKVINLIGKKPLSSGLGSASKHLPVGCSEKCDKDSDDSYTEVSDQNFTGEAIEGEKLNGVCSVGGMTVVVAEASNDDQVVPLGKSPVTEDIAENCVSS